MTLQKLAALALLLLLTGCATVVKVDGDQKLDKMAVTLPEAWNRLAYPGQPFEVWTQEGASIDQLRFWTGLQAGQEIVRLPPPAAGQKAARVPTFTGKNMALDELAGLFEILYSADGSQVRMTRIEPGHLAGASGVRFEFLVTTKTTDLQMRGMGWAVVRDNRLYAATYTAPNLAFFKRLARKAQAVLSTAHFTDQDATHLARMRARIAPQTTGATAMRRRLRLCRRSPRRPHRLLPHAGASPCRPSRRRPFRRVPRPWRRRH